MKPRKSSDRRALHITETVEAEAMPANILRTMLREKVEEFLPADALWVAKVAEKSEREHLDRWAAIMSNYDSDEAAALLYECIKQRQRARKLPVSWSNEAS